MSNVYIGMIKSKLITPTQNLLALYLLTSVIDRLRSEIGINATEVVRRKNKRVVQEKEASPQISPQADSPWDINQQKTPLILQCKGDFVGPL
jgi:hypothetical protein